MEASGFGHLAEKVNFLAKLNHGPFKGGRWLGVQKMAAKAFVDAVRNNDSVAVDLFEAAVASISAEMSWAGPETAQARTLARLRLTSPLCSHVVAATLACTVDHALVMLTWI